MRETKRRIAQFTFYDRTGIQKDLERMAGKGWLLEKMTPFYWQFRRIEPAKLHFAVTYFPKGSEFDPEPTEGQKSLIEFCGEAGWKFIGSTAQIQIFYNEADDPVPIDTDASVELKNIHASAKGNFLIAQFLLLAVGVLNLGMSAVDFVRDPLYVLGSNSKLITILCWMMLLLLSSVEILGYFRWYRRAKRAVEADGSFVATKGTRRFQLSVLAFLLIVYVFYVVSMSQGIMRFALFMSVLWVVSLFAIVNLVKNVLKKNKVSREITRAVTFTASFACSFLILWAVTKIIFQVSDLGWFEKQPVGTYAFHGGTRNIYDDEIPLKVEDMISMEDFRYSYEKEEESSLFLRVSECRQRDTTGEKDMPDLWYRVTEVKIPGMYDYCVNAVMDQFYGGEQEKAAGYHFKECDPKLWGAERVYQFADLSTVMNRYLVCYEEHYAVISFYWTPTEEQMQIAGEKLKKL